MTRLLDSRTRKLGERLLRAARDSHDRIVSNGHAQMLENTLDGRVLSFTGGDWKPGEREQVAGEFHMASVFRQWDRNRIIYATHPDLVTELASATTTPIPGEIWNLIPHTEPLVLFPAAAEIKLPAGETGHLAGFFVHGRRVNGSVCPIHAEDRAAVGLVFLIELPGHAGVEFIRTTVHTAEPKALEEMVADGLQQFHTTDGPPPTDPLWSAYLRTLLNTAISVLLYACTDDRDLTSMPAAPGRRATRRPKRGVMYALGWHLGPALHSARRQAMEYRDVGAGGGRRQPPHQRSCSIRTYWTGKGREIPRLKFVKPYNVSQDLLANLDEQPHRVIPLRP